MGTPRKRDRSATEERLLKAAESVFARMGFQGATTKLIAKESGVNESLIARYFSGKTGLLFAILRNHIEVSLALRLPYPPQESLDQELRHYAKFTAQKYEDAIHTVKILVTQALVDERFNIKIRGLLPKSMNAELAARLTTLKNNGMISQASDVERVIAGLETQIFGHYLLRVVMLGEEMGNASRVLETFAHDCARILSGPDLTVTAGS